MIGRSVSHYRVLERLGKGGMGIVYKAEDTRLKRTVALKFLPPELTRDPEAKERFVREAQAASSLQHENICVVYDIDESEGARMFISMEYVEGETLREKIEGGPLSIEDAVRIASQSARALARAHEAGIIHRDIKPANIMVTKNRQVKILDFGLATALSQSHPAKGGPPHGTVAYMSPEQARGEAVDCRTDIWSLGTVLYEMVTGKRPFGGDYDQAAMYAILNESHRPASVLRGDVPDGLDRIINRCLEKMPEARFPSAALLLDELKVLGQSPSPVRRTGSSSLAVLPFSDIGAEKDNMYISDGLTEEIIAKLSRLRNVRVISRASVVGYDRTGKSVKRIAAELGVQYLLEGSVRRHANDLRITTQLIDADQDSYLWAETYDGAIDKIFEIQEDVAGRIVKALRVRLTPAEKRTLRRRGTENTDAYQLYLKGRFFWNRRKKEDLFTAIRLFEEAIDKDDHYALAWAGVADSYLLLGDYANMPRNEVVPKAKAAIRKALDLDGRLAEAHASLGILTMLTSWDWVTSEKELKLAMKLDPNYATAHHWYAEWCSCHARFGEAIAEITRAVELDPLSPGIIKDKGMILYYARDYDGAIEWGKKTFELDPHFSTAHRLLSLAYQGKRMFDESIAENNAWGNLRGNDVEATVALAQCYAAAGRKGEALDMIRKIPQEDLKGGNLFRGLALVCASLGEIDQAFAWFEKSFAEQAESLGVLKVDPKTDPLRSDPRYRVLLNRVGLEK
jgi:serine/threonine-protein kinase